MASGRSSGSGLEPRVGTVLFAIAAVGVPTYFTIFPASAQDWPWGVRAGILACWVLIAGTIGFTATRLDERLGDYLGAKLDKRSDERFLAGSIAIRSVLKEASTNLRDVEWRVFLYDDQEKKLLASYDSRGSVDQSTGWGIGLGATGRAYDTGEYVVARGAECSDGTYGLTTEEQRRYRRLRAVAALPLKTATGKVIGVLTGSSRKEDSALLLPDGQDTQITCGTVVTRLLIDVLKHASD